MRARRAITALATDAAAVLVFVAAGRRSHEEGLTVLGIARTAAPFLLGLGAGWLATRAWRAPASLSTGLGVWAATAAGGLVLRALVFGDGVAPAFVVVAICALGLLLVGWRLAARALRPGRADLGLE